jgi:predicted PurR-regulated permease PerM
MLGIDRRTLQVAWTLFLFALILLTVYQVRRTLVIFAFALMLAHLLAPIVNFVERLVPERVPRLAALAFVYVILLGIIALALVPVVSRISVEAASLAAKIPDALQGDPMDRLPTPRILAPYRPQIVEFLRDRLTEFGHSLGPVLAQAGSHIITGISSFLVVILVPILSFFFLKDGTKIRDAIVRSFEADRRELVDNIFNDLHILLDQYVRALVLLSIATFVSYSIFLAAVGVAFPMLLAGGAALLEFIPVIGPVTAWVVILVAGSLTGFPHLLWIVLFLVLYRGFQDYVLSPFLMSSGVELPPMLVLFGVLAGDQLAGIPGMFFSVPVMAALRLVILRLRNPRRRIETD